MSSQIDVVVVGAGFAGMYMIHRQREAGRTVQGFEAGTDVGGTWYWNRYPGARCDVESLEYSYDFDNELQQEWQWSEKYSAQPEILAYAQHVADRYDIRDHIQFETSVVSATFDEAAATWSVTTSDGVTTLARFLVLATGCLSSANLPDISGRDSFGGELVHTGRWPKDGVDLEGKRVGVIGTGSSGIQAIPVIAEQADHLTVFQRTAQYTIPARNSDLDPAEQAAIKEEYEEFRADNRRMPAAFGSKQARRMGRALEATPAQVEAEFEFLWERGGTLFLSSFRDLALDPAANEMAAAFVRRKIAEVVENPAVAARLTPDGLIGCKRLVVDSGYYETYNQPHVDLVDVSDTGSPITAITATGVQTSAGHYELDVLVFATGFDAMTGSILRIDIRGRSGQTIQDKWEAGPRTYLGLGIEGFPNMFTVTGPGSPSVLANMIIATQQHVDWITACLDHLDAAGHTTIEAGAEAEQQWIEHVNSIADKTIYPTCNSWYVGANIPGKTRVFMPLPGFPGYVDICDEVTANNYEGFILN